MTARSWRCRCDRPARVERRLLLEHLQRHLGVRPARAQLARAAGQQPGGGRREGADAHLRTADTRRFVHGLLGSPRGVEQRGGVAHEHFARRRQGHAPRAALEHTRAERLLEAADVLRDGGLREVECNGGVAE